LGGPSFIVSNTRDTGIGTLREAIINANIMPGTQTVSFAILAGDARHLYYRNDSVAGQVSLDQVAVTTAANDGAIADIDPDWAHSWYSFRPSRNLPEIIDAIVIDGYTQPGSSPNTLPPLGPLDTVLKIELDGTNSPADGFALGFDAGHSTIKGMAINRFGGDGIELNTLDGGNIVAGNFIGMDVSGMAALGNGANGVLVNVEVGTIIGGNDAASRNLISANAAAGIELRDPRANAIRGNNIGMDRIVSFIAPNETSAVLFTTSDADQPTSSAGTSASEGHGIDKMSNEASDTLFSGFNYGQAQGMMHRQRGRIGDPHSAKPLDDTTIKKLNAFLPKNIQSDPSQGGHAAGTPTPSPTFLFMGIDLGLDGVTLNDLGDADEGPNGLQNYPVLSAATTISGATTVAGTLNSLANTSFHLEFYSNTTGPNFRAGEKYLGSLDITTNAQGDTAFTFGAPLVVQPGEFVTATATRLADETLASVETSEFATPIVVNPPRGDYNSDATVDAADYVVWRNALGQQVAPFAGADGSGNGLVDQADHEVWRARFGQSGPGAAMSALDAEPTTSDGVTAATAAFTTWPAAEHSPRVRARFANALPAFAPGRRGDFARAGHEASSPARFANTSAAAASDEGLLGWLAAQAPRERLVGDVSSSPDAFDEHPIDDATVVDDVLDNTLDPGTDRSHYALMML
jgi:hypothetical protein